MTETQVSELLAQIGKMNVLAISGGRVKAINNFRGELVGLRFPCGAGYRVDVLLAFDDTYTVRRVYVRSGKEFVHGEETGIYCDEVGETAWIASCYSCYTFGKKEES